MRPDARPKEIYPVASAGCRVDFVKKNLARIQAPKPSSITHPEHIPPLFASQIGGATYFKEEGGLQFYVIVVPYEGLAGFKDLVNSSVEMEFPDKGPTLDFISGLPIFYQGDEASTKFTMLALRDHAAYITTQTTDESALSDDQLIATALVIFDALTGQTSSQSAAPQEAPANLVPASLIDATLGYDEGNDR